MRQVMKRGFSYKKLMIGGLLLAFLGALIACGDPEESDANNAETTNPIGKSADKLEIVPLFAEVCTGDIDRTEAGMEVIESEDSFEQALEETIWVHTPAEARELPEVDFEQFVVLAAYSGFQPQCSGEFSISEAIEHEESVEVTVTRVQCAVGDDSVSWPYVFVMVPRLDKPYVFVEEAVEGDC